MFLFPLKLKLSHVFKMSCTVLSLVSFSLQTTAEEATVVLSVSCDVSLECWPNLETQLQKLHSRRKVQVVGPKI